MLVVLKALGLGQGQGQGKGAAIFLSGLGLSGRVSASHSEHDTVLSPVSRPAWLAFLAALACGFCILWPQFSLPVG